MVRPNTEAENTEISDIVEEAQTEPTEPVRFQELALPEPLLKAITKLGFEECTPIRDGHFLSVCPTMTLRAKRKLAQVKLQHS